MDLIFLINIVALLFSFFIGGVLVGVLFSNTFRKKIIDALIKDTPLILKIESTKTL